MAMAISNGVECSDLSDWMSKLSPSLHDTSLSELAIPGTHNSFSFSIDPKSELGPDVAGVLKVLGALAKGVVRQWSVTQNQTFREQLESGIRFFDLRVAFHKGSQHVRFIHGMYGETVENGINEITDFLKIHSKEVIILDFNHFYEMSEQQHREFLNLLQDKCGDKLCLFVGVENLKLNMLWENNLQIIVLYHHQIAAQFVHVWPGNQCIRSLWANTASIPQLIEYLESHYKKDRCQGLHVCQFVLTPDPNFIFTHLAGSLEKDLAMKASSAAIQWISRKCRGRNGINIVTADFTNLCEFARQVIDLNVV